MDEALRLSPGHEGAIASKKELERAKLPADVDTILEIGKNRLESKVSVYSVF